MRGNSGNIPTGTSKNELNSLFWELFWRNMLLSVSLILQHLVKKPSAKPHHRAHDDYIGKQWDQAFKTGGYCFR